MTDKSELIAGAVILPIFALTAPGYFFGALAIAMTIEALEQIANAEPEPEPEWVEKVKPVAKYKPMGMSHE